MVIDEIDAPSCTDGHVLVSTNYVGVQYPDMLQAQGLYQEKPELPYVPCMDMTGTVLEVGESMTCSAGGVASEGPYVNVGTASGQPPTGEPVSAADASHYLGGQILHADDFESGDTSAWDGRKPP